MTCIVYRDGALAADARVLDLWTPCGDVPKIGKRTGPGGTLLFGAAGESSYVQIFLDWVKSEQFDEWLADGGKGAYCDMGRPEKPDKETNGYVILPDGTCLRFESGAPAYVMRAPFYAFGSGTWSALGALHMGATAAQAVEIAAKCDIGTGPLASVLYADDREDWHAPKTL
ncbi:peptidase HslV family [Caulobacter phage CcrBL10]|uniref:Putative NTN hydrolase domain protein n=1 Tax=Caulobacter phage CcrBL10 TaxID=2283269 RepID=A0A385E971_9CAUD|nr:peptidase HslV family [Caulobacter phage CcrBL10]AXQ68353.1 putative NTN hydrolase domain protein [Caulobacter phage CcrBL10]